jgi:hypothetical protein
MTEPQPALGITEELCKYNLDRATKPLRDFVSSCESTQASLVPRP